MIEKLQYITQETRTLSHIDCVREACIAGVKWIQLRVKDKTPEEVLAIAKEARLITELYDVKLIVNDSVEVAKEVEADGVHLGKTDMYISEARKILGEGYIVGGTANTLQDVERLIEHEADYIGLGPFQFTETKKNLSPMLGIEGYEEIINALMSKYRINEVPIIAVGGIEHSDIQDLLDAGVYGVAVSGLITKDFTITEKLNTILNNESKLEKLITIN